MSATKFTLSDCTLSDCMFYTPEPANEAKCRCTHPERFMHIKQARCPLYRLDWQKKLQSAPPIPQLPGSYRPKPAR